MSASPGTPLRTDERAYLWMDDPQVPMQIALLGVLDAAPFLRDGRLDTGRVRSELDARAARLPELGRRAVTSASRHRTARRPNRGHRSVVRTLTSVAVLDQDLLAARVATYPRVAADRPDLKQAAVALCVTEREGTPCLVLTRRAVRLRGHAGQWALPGGRRDPGESAVDGALRETREEVGVALEPGAVLGVLDDYVTRSGYVMTPVVCWAGAVGELEGAAAEVSAVHQVPLADLDVEPRLIAIPESDAPVIQLPLFGRYLHAPTAAIVHQFCRIACRGLVERVAHYEQPVFAWR